MKIFETYDLSGPLFLAILVLSPIAGAQPDTSDTTGMSAPLFSSHEPLMVTIEAPLTTLMTERPEEEYLNGAFSFTASDGTAHSLDLKIRTRGNFRRMEENCDFAPIRLNFRKKQIEGTIFEGQDKLKLVTHCQTGNTYFEQLVLREYLAYQFFRVLTDKSFGVRLFQITYVDTESVGSMSKIGFVIEDVEDVADRIGLKRVKTADITHAELDSRQENLINVFQYMIGNTDYSLIKVAPGKSCCHNIELMSASVGPPFTPIPFDFDFAGLINAPYASANPKFRLRNVRQRLYRGQCRNNELLPQTIQHFLDNKAALFGVIDEVESLRGRSRRDVTSYLETFFDRISDPKKVNSAFIEKCVGSE